MSDSQENILVEVTTPIYGGECMGRLPDGRAVFVPYTLPGEQVRVHLVEQHRGFARARLVEVVRPSPDRITPRCIHYGVCGGCHFQHTTYANQLKLKQAVVRDQLERIGGIANPLVDEVIPSPAGLELPQRLAISPYRGGKTGLPGLGDTQRCAHQRMPPAGRSAQPDLAAA